MSASVKDKFYNVYSNLPINLRREVIAVINNDPVTWQVAKLEIDSNTELGNQILDKLELLQII